MDRELIIQTLKSTCGNKNLKYQVIVQHEQLYIYINRRQNYQPDYLRLKENIGLAIANLALENLDGVWLYSRPKGQIEPDWQTFLELPTQVTSGNDDTLNQTEDVQSELLNFAEFEFPTADSTGDTGLLQDTGMVHNNFLKEEKITSAATSAAEIAGDNIQDLIENSEFPKFEDFEGTDSTGDTGLLHDTGFIHGSPLKEEIDIFTTGVSDSQLLKVDNLNSDNLNLDSSSLAQHYCFITNEKLLTGEVTPPSKEIMRLVKFFHHLADSERYILLPILDNYFKQRVVSNLEERPIAIQNWYKQISELNDRDRQIAAIWLSRYCANKSDTLSEFQAITAQNAADAVDKQAKKSANRATEYSFTPVKVKNSSLQDKELELSESKLKLPPAVKKLILPLAWIFATVFFLALGIFSHHSNIVIADQQIPALCNNSLGPEYCRLAVNLVGEKTVARPPQSLFPLTEVTEKVATYGCQRFANFKAGIPPESIPPEITPVTSSSGSKIFPHVYVIEAQQKNFLKSGNTRVGCVYTTGQEQRSPKKLAADVIPLNWPTEYYQQQQTNLSFGRYTSAIGLGLHTIFAALGIAIASWLNLGVKVNRASAVYLVALILGIFQLVAASVPFLGLLATCILPILGIFIASFAIKDFQLDRTRGYPLIATGIFIIITVQFLFYSLSMELISSLG